jgi:hypothetical protein
MNKFRPTFKRKIKPVSIVIDLLIVAFFAGILFLIVKRNTQDAQDSEQLYGAFHYEVLDSGVVLTEYLGSETEPEIPEEIEGQTVNSIAQNCFKGNTYIEKITIPSNIWGIGIGAFKGCINLKTVVLEDGVEMIASYAFQNCKGLEAVVIPDSVETIGMCAFQDASEFTIVGTEGSTAQAYAQENEITFEIK